MQYFKSNIRCYKPEIISCSLKFQLPLKSSTFKMLAIELQMGLENSI